jgi:hypothetical protein
MNYEEILTELNDVISILESIRDVVNSKNAKEIGHVRSTLIEQSTKIVKISGKMI